MWCMHAVAAVWWGASVNSSGFECIHNYGAGYIQNKREAPGAVHLAVALALT
jgi:hypothetical protein